MARIRTVKPEFWTSEQIVECSPTARLMFIGLWNFCDDNGIHPYSVKTIKMEIFPGDPFTVEQVELWLNELISAGLVKTYHIDNKQYFIVTGWHHQKIDKPNAKYPLPDKFDDHSSKVPRPIDDHSPPEGSLRESKGIGMEDINTSPDKAVESDKIVDASKSNGCPHQQIIALYHEILPALPKVRVWTEDLQKILRTRWKEDRDRQSLEWWKDYFYFVSQCPYLLGKINEFTADLEWLIRPKNMPKILNGRYLAKASGKFDGIKEWLAERKSNAEVG